jgi:hypothetical protein
MSESRKRPLREMFLPTTYTRTVSDTPIIVRQFLQLALLIAWPFFAVGAVVFAAVDKLVWGAFWPLRAYMKKHHPEDYEASQRK